MVTAAIASEGATPRAMYAEPEDRERESDRREEPAVSGSRDPVAQERSDQRAHPACRHQDAEPHLAGIEDVERHHRDQREQTGGGAESELHGEERQDPVVAAREPPCLLGRLDDPRMLGGPPGGLGEGTPDRGEQRGGDQERDRVDEERRVRAERVADETSEPRADGEHRSPQRPVQRVRNGQVSGIDHVGGRGREGGVERGREGREEGQQHVGEPQRLRSDQQERDADHRPREVADDHQLPPVDTVGQHATDGRREEERELLSHDRQAHVKRLAGGLVDQPVDRHPEEPIAAQGDHGGEEQRAEIPVAADQRHARAQTGVRRACGDRRVVHGGSPAYRRDLLQDRPDPEPREEERHGQDEEDADEDRQPLRRAHEVVVDHDHPPLHRLVPEREDRQ